MSARLVFVAREIVREMRRTRRRKQETMTTAAILAALPDVPLPHAIEKLFAEIARDMFPPRAMTGAAGGPPRTAAPLSETPDFSPDFLLNVKQCPVIRRTEAAEICGVSLDWFDRNVARLMRDQLDPFPAPRDATGQKRWDRAAVAAWSRRAVATHFLARARASHAKAKATIA